MFDVPPALVAEQLRVSPVATIGAGFKHSNPAE